MSGESRNRSHLLPLLLRPAANAKRGASTMVSPLLDDDESSDSGSDGDLTDQSSIPQRRRRRRRRPRFFLQNAFAATRTRSRHSQPWTSAAEWAFVTLVLLAAEVLTWMRQRGEIAERIVPFGDSADQSMRIDLNVTFHALHCDNVHVDVQEVNTVRTDGTDTLIKQRLHLDGTPFSSTELSAELALSRKKHWKALIGEITPDDDGTRDDYADGEDFDDEPEPEPEPESESGRGQPQWDAQPRSPSVTIKRGEGCNLSGFVTVGRSFGNVHVLMGRGIDTIDGRHIHNFEEDAALQFNASHTIHHLSFGPRYTLAGKWGSTTLDGVSKTVTNDNGVTGLFQYYIKVVPTRYRGTALVSSISFPAPPSGVLETNRYFFTEVYKPLVTETGRAMLIPGVVFVYDVYPMAVEFTNATVSPWILLFWMVATVGGVITIRGWWMRRGDGPSGSGAVQRGSSRRAPEVRSRNWTAPPRPGQNGRKQALHIPVV